MSDLTLQWVQLHRQDWPLATHNYELRNTESDECVAWCRCNGFDRSSATVYGYIISNGNAFDDQELRREQTIGALRDRIAKEVDRRSIGLFGLDEITILPGIKQFTEAEFREGMPSW